MFHHAPWWTKAQCAIADMVIPPADRPKIFRLSFGGHLWHIGTVQFYIHTSCTACLHNLHGWLIHSVPSARPCSPCPAFRFPVEIRHLEGIGWNQAGVSPSCNAHHSRIIFEVSQ